MSVKLTNNASSTLAANISSSATAIALPSGDGAKFPTLGAGDWFPATIVDSSANREIVRVTAIAGDSLTVARGQEDTVGRSFLAGDRIDLRLTAGAVADIQESIAALSTLAASLAPLASPALTGDPTAPTPTAGDDSTAIATTDFVVNAIASGVTKSGDAFAGVPSGTVVLTLKQTAPAGWLMFADQTIGDTASGATYANNDALNIFNDLYALADADAPIFTSTGAAATRAAVGNAAAAWAANVRVLLPKMLGRALAVAGAGAALTARAIGSAVGVEAQAIAQANLPDYDLPANSAATVTGTITFNQASGGSIGSIAISTVTPATGSIAIGDGAPLLGQHTNLSADLTDVIHLGGSGTALPVMQPTTFLNAMIKK